MVFEQIVFFEKSGSMKQEGKQMLRSWVSISAATASLIRGAWPGLRLCQSFAGYLTQEATTDNVYKH